MIEKSNPAGRLEKLSCLTPGALLLIAAPWSLFLMGNSSLPGEPSQVLISDLLFPVLGVLVTGIVALAARRTARISPRLGLAWGILAAAALANTIGDVIWAVLELGFNQPPTPSPADAFYLLFYPLFALGVLLIPSQKLSRIERLTTYLDISAILISALLGAWNIVIGPTLASIRLKPVSDQLIASAYPSGIILLLSAVLMLIYRRPHIQPKAPLLVIAAGAVIAIISDGFFRYQVLAGIYQSGSLIDLGWYGTLACFATAGLMQLSQLAKPDLARQATAFNTLMERIFYRWAAFYPYIWMAAAYLLVIWGYTHTNYMNFYVTVFGVGVIITLVMIRQLVMWRENNRLNADLNATMKKLTHDALHDLLTGLPNRSLLLERLERSIHSTRKEQDSYYPLLFMDCDHFKLINDSLGHPAGDQLLIQLAERLKTCVRAGDTVARLGGDEFIILLGDTQGIPGILQVANRVQEVFSMPFVLGNQTVNITGSTGIVANVQEYGSAEDVLRDADIAMYHAKALGKDRYEFFTPNLRDQVVSRLEAGRDLRRALDNQELELLFQPVMRLKPLRLVGFETSVRWRHAVHGLFQQDELVRTAEEAGLTQSLSGWMLSKACAQMSAWRAAYPAKKSLTISVSVPTQHFLSPDFTSQVEDTLKAAGLENRVLVLSVDENVFLNHPDTAPQVYHRIQEKGIGIEIDSFATIYSPLGYPQNLSSLRVKIGPSAIQGPNPEGRLDVVRALMSVAQVMPVVSIVKGIQTLRQLDELKALGCQFGQGDLFSRPLEAEAAENMLRAKPGTTFRAPMTPRSTGET